MTAPARPARSRRRSAAPVVGGRLPHVTVAGDRIGPAVTGGTYDVVAIALRPADEGGPAGGWGTREVEELFGVVVADEARLAEASGAVRDVVTVPVAAVSDDGEGVACSRLLLVGVGDGSPLALRRAGAALARAVKGRDALLAAVAADADDEGLRAFVEGLSLASYSFTRKSEPATAAVGAVGLVLARPEARAGAVARALTTATAVERARDLANTPADVEDPAWLAAAATGLADGAGLQVRVRDEAELAAEGFHGIVAVGGGSATPPRLIELRYEPEGADARTPHVVLVGKGITFDTGGLWLKPRESMVPMKTDMSGGAAVVATLAALRDLGVKVRVTGLVPAAENAIGASAMRPGDVITHYGGRTVEVLNTDAEGRLVLADALAYADAVLQPDLVVDVATLTGAASLGLGKRHAALYATDERLAAGLEAAGDASGERVWRMPLVEDYRQYLDSPVADLANIPRDKHVSGGSITAALFLREFAGSRAWAHLDIAGPARSDGDEHEVTRGGTGFGTRLLLRWLEQLTPRAAARRR
ncbi:MAG: leucyl aminopeptidase family protein [Motilibacteraceae bacterium]